VVGRSTYPPDFALRRSYFVAKRERNRPMNVQALERLVRDALRGNDLNTGATRRAEEGSITLIEHRSVNALAQQISNGLKSGNTELNDMSDTIPNLTWL